MSAKQVFKTAVGLAVLLAKFAYKVLLLLWTYPHYLIVGWLLGWATILYKTYALNGFPQTFLLMTTGVFNVGSAFGLPIPLFGLYVLLYKLVVTTVFKWLESVFYKLFRKVKKAFETAYKKIQKVISSIDKNIKKLSKALKGLFKKAGSIKKGGKKKLKASLAPEMYEVQQAHEDLLADLDELGNIAPETSDVVDHLKNVSEDMVLSVTNGINNPERLGSSANDTSELYEVMLGYFGKLTERLADELVQ